jgi:tetraacyldisaccharide 4'-kinase
LKRLWALPLTPLYAAGLGLRAAGLRMGLERVERLALPVISVGSLSAGGAGKTPMVVALARLMKEQGWKADVLSRGYGRADSRAARVDPEGSAEMYGDEPLLIARETGVPVYVGASRLAAGKLAEESGAKTQVHLLDDGFQHRQLWRDADVVLVSSEDLGDWLLPAGNRREMLSALGRATVLAVETGDEAAIGLLGALGFGAKQGQPIWRYQRKIEIPEALTGPDAQKAVAFCGIARPGQFFSGLETGGVGLAARHAFSDHHRFTAADLKLLRGMVAKAGAKALITTAKDRVRMGAMAEQLGVKPYVAGLQTIFADEDGVAGWLGNVLQA